MCLKTCNINEAYDWLLNANRCLDKIDDTKLGRDEIALIKIRYKFSIANILFLK